MAELTPQERLQPSLLDRLTDEEPDKNVEPRERRVLSLRQLRQSVLRDLAWLLNTSCLSQTDDLTDFPHVAKSVLNYGMRDLAGTTVSTANLGEIEKGVRHAIEVFEPRVLSKSIRVKAVGSHEHMNKNALSFQIEGELWAQPVPLHLLLRTELDLESGDLTVTEQAEGRP